jgi:hypothetical protein
VKEILDKIQTILSSNAEDFSEPFVEDEMVEAYDEFEMEELYTDIYVLVRNIDEFYGENASPKAALLLESFLLESMVLLKKDPENIVVESGEFYVKATSFTPDGEVVLSVFEDVVLINSMIEYYNDALANNEFPQMEIGIGFATFVKEDLLEEDEECDTDDESCSCHNHDETEEHTCHCSDDEECECGHDHYNDEEDEDYGIDFNNTALQLAELANSDDLDPIVINDLAYDMLVEVDQTFFESHLEAVSLEDDFVVYHGNIVVEE